MISTSDGNFIRSGGCRNSERGVPTHSGFVEPGKQPLLGGSGGMPPPQKIFENTYS